MDSLPTGPARWQVRLLGSLSAGDGAQTITQFGGRSVAALLARLAMFPQRSHAREELVELLWPGVAHEVGRNRLRQTLFALRALLEPPGAPAQPVLIADRASVRVHEGALDCDAVRFERAVRDGRHADAMSLYAGELLPGHYDEWIADERLRLAALADRASDALAKAPAAPPRATPRHDPPATARRERSALPAYLTRFFGREVQRERLREAIEAHRLVTLLGPGGCGKTRLAVECAAAWRDAVPARFDLVLFAPLVGCRTRAALLDTLVAAARLPADRDDKPAQLADALSGRRVLLVLDNFEQLVEVAGDVVADLAALLPQVHLLVTSRRALGLDGETEFVLAPLALPEGDLAIDAAAANPAVALFVDRARAARTDFHLSERNRATLLALARVLEGLPLAIELAASRIRSVAPAQMLAHLEPGGPTPGTERLALLARSGVRAGLDPRHASMQRTIEWSWQLLAPAAQCLLAELTVFQGGFDVAAAAAVAVSADDQPMLLRLDELVAHSLLGVTTPAPAQTNADTPDDDAAAASHRFSLSEPIREFAAATLSPSRAAGLRSRHRAWLTAWGVSFAPTPPLATLRSEMRNIAAALDGALSDGMPREGVALMVALRRGLPDTTVPAALLAQFEKVLGSCGDDMLASRGHTLMARLALGAGRGEAARGHAERGLALARVCAAGTGDGDELLARALHGAASAIWRTLRDGARAETLLDEAQPAADRCGDAGVQASLLALRGFIANVAHRDPARAERLHAQALALWERAGDRISANNGHYNLAVCAMRARRHAEGLVRLDAVAAQAERQQDWRLLAQACNVQGEAHWGLRHWAEAADAYRRSADLAWNVLAVQPLAYALWNLPHALARLRRPEPAARLGGAAERLWQAQVGPLSDGDRKELRLLRRLVAVQLGRPRADALWAEGARLGLADAVALALERSS